MNKNLLRCVAAVLIAMTGVSCTTAYDAYGRPQAVVDPGVALLGAAAVGVAAYALANNNNHYNRGYSRGYSRNYACAPRPSYYRNTCYSRPYYGW